jgi:hypothetical protein
MLLVVEVFEQRYQLIAFDQQSVRVGDQELAEGLIARVVGEIANR